MRDLDAGTTILVSDQIPGVPASSPFTTPVLSPDGRFVAFTQRTSSLSLFVRDLPEGTAATLGTNSLVTLGTAAISEDSRWLVVVTRRALASGVNLLGLLFHDHVQGTNREVVFADVPIRLYPSSLLKNGCFLEACQFAAAQ